MLEHLDRQEKLTITTAGGSVVGRTGHVTCGR
jgi:hypothetical protein